MQPLVSISIITYNQINFIHETLDSALSQDYENIEIIVADDGSSDGTSEIILEYARIYPDKITPLIGGPNLGITGNSNRALEACKGEFIAFQGGDDILLPGKILKQLEWFQKNPKRIMCYHDVEVFDSESGNTIYLFSEKFKMRKGMTPTIIRFGTFFCATSVMIRVSKSENIYFDKKISVSSDWLYWIDTLQQQNGVIGFIPGIYARYRRHNNNITKLGLHGFKDSLMTLEIVECKYPQYTFVISQKRTEIYFLHAWMLLSNNNLWECLRYLMKSFVASRCIWLSPLLLIAKKLLGLKI